MFFHTEISLLAFLTDLIIGELRIKHPISFMGDYITYFEKRFYKDSFFRGIILSLSLLVLVLLFSYFIEYAVQLGSDYFELIILGIISSSGIAGNMLYNSVKNVLTSNNPKIELSMLVSRDTNNMDDSDINKACIETYSENISDGLVAPLFYLLLFGFEAMFIYKAINTLDSMVGYRTNKYNKFGRFSARLDDIVNFIPSRITGFIIFIVSFRLSSLKYIFKFAHLHDSPNAGIPISAMAGALGIALGGNTYYNGILKNKPYFGYNKIIISKAYVYKALSYHNRINLLIFLFLLGLLLWKVLA